MNTKKILPSLKVIILAAILAVGVQYLHAFTSSPGTPPSCPTGYPGCDAPLNVGSSAQTKLGPLTVNGSTTAQATIGLYAWGQAVFNYGGVGTSAIQIIDGSQGAGKVLTSDANGNATWGTAGAGAGVPNNVVTFSTSQQWTAPAGVTRILVRAWGAGGSGADGGSGGGGGGYAESAVSVIPGTQYSITVGAGGAPVIGGGPGANGGASIFGSNVVVAQGGSGGPSSGQNGASGVAFGGGASATGGNTNVGNITIDGGPGAVSDGFTPLMEGGSSPEGGSGGLGGGPDASPGKVFSIVADYYEQGVTPGGGGSGVSSSGNWIASNYYSGQGGDGEVILEY